MTSRARPQLVSVVVPVLNNASTLAQQLDALASQDYPAGFEIIVVDNGSQDGSKEIAVEKASTTPNIRVVDAHRRSANHARNVGVSAAAGELIAFCDGDDVASPSWLSAVAERAVECDAVAGRLDVELLNEPTAIEWRTEILQDRLPVGLGFLPYGISANLAVWADALSDIGGWDESFRIGGTEVDLCWRLQLHSYRLCFARDAVMHYRLRNSITGVVRQGYRFGRSDVMLYRKFRQHDIRRHGVRSLATLWARLLRTSPDLLRSRAARGRWLHSLAFRLGRLGGTLKHRTLFL